MERGHYGRHLAPKASGSLPNSRWFKSGRHNQRIHAQIHRPQQSAAAITNSYTHIRIDFATEQSVPVGGEDQDGILGLASGYSTPSRQPESPCSLSNG